MTRRASASISGSSPLGQMHTSSDALWAGLTGQYGKFINPKNQLTIMERIEPGVYTLTAVHTKWIEPDDWNDGYWLYVLKLNGRIYGCCEDKDDGYRSLGCFYEMQDCECSDNLPPTQVMVESESWDYYADNGYYCAGWMITILDMVTGKVILKVGTDHSDAYYPMAIFHWHPENLACNQNK